MPLDQETISQQQTLLAAHRRTLAALLHQQALLGGAVHAPPGLLSSIEEARASIARIKMALRDADVQVDDEAIDEAPRLTTALPMPNRETIQQQLSLLASHRRTLSHLVQQAAQYGGEVFTPPETANGLASVRTAIAHIKEWLRENGTDVKDEPNDLASPQLPSKAIIQVRSDVVSERRNIPILAPPKPNYFIERLEITQRLKNILLRDIPVASSSNPACVIYGMGGIGKTTLAAALAHDADVRQRFNDGVLWMTLGEHPNLLVEFSAWVRELGDHDFQPITTETTLGHLRSLLQDKAILLVVDDCWSLDHVRLFQIGGPHCQIIITTRHASVANQVGAQLHELETMSSTESLALLSLRLQRNIHPEEEKEAAQLASLVGYLPLALELVAARVAHRTPWTKLREALEAEIARLEELEDPDLQIKGYSQLEACFNVSLNALHNLDELAWRSFVLLGVLAEDAIISAPLASAVWGLDRQKSDFLLNLYWTEALLLSMPSVNINKESWRGYRIHDLMRHFTRRLLTKEAPNGLAVSLELAHNNLIESYKKRTKNGLWHTLQDDHYIHAHLIHHLKKSGRQDEVHDLLEESTFEGRNGWYHVREQLGQAAGFLTDTMAAWSLIETSLSSRNVTPESLIGKDREESKRSPGKIFGLLIRYSLFMTSFNSVATNIPSVLLTILVKKRKWTPDQGLAYARQIPDPTQRAQTLIMIAFHLPKPLQDKILREALAEKEVSVSIYDTLSKAVEFTGLNLPPLELREHINVHGKWFVPPKADNIVIHEPINEWGDGVDLGLMSSMSMSMSMSMNANMSIGMEVLRLTQELPNEWICVQTLLKWLPSLPELLQGAALAEALEVTQAIDDDELRALTMTDLVPHLPDRLLHRVLEIAEAADHEEFQAQTLVALGKHLPLSQQKQFLVQAWEIANTIEEEDSRARLFVSLAIQAPKQFQRQALVAIQMMGNPEVKAQALTMLITYLPSTTRKNAINQALTAAQSIYQEFDRIPAIVALFPYLPKQLKIEEMREVLELVKSIEDELARTKVLERLVSSIPAELLSEALSIAKEITKPDIKAKALVALASRLNEASQKALVTIRKIKGSSTCAAILIDLVPHLSKKLLPEALQIAQSLSDTDDRTRVLEVLVPKLSQINRFEESLKGALMIENAEVRAQVLVNVAPSFPSRLQSIAVSEALSAARRIQDIGSRAQILATLGPQLVEIDRFHMILEAIRAIAQPDDRRQALVTLASYVEEPWLSQVLVEISVIGDVSAQAQSVLALIVQLAKMNYVELAWQIGQVTLKDQYWGQMLRVLLPYLSPQLLPEALKIIHILDPSQEQNEALSTLIPRLAELDHVEEAITMARQMTSDEYKAMALLALVPSLSRGFLLEALIITQTVRSKEYRSQLQSEIIMRLAHLGLPNEALSAIDIIPDAQGKNQVLENLAIVFAKQGLFELAVNIVQEFAANEQQAQVINSIISYLPENLVCRVHEMAKKIKLPKNSPKVALTSVSHLHSNIAHRLLEFGYSDRYLPIMNRVPDRGYKAKQIAETIVNLPDYLHDKAFAEIVSSVNQIGDLLERSELLNDLIPYISGKLKLQLIQRIIEELLSSNTRNPDGVLQILAPQMDAHALAVSLGIVRLIEDLESRMLTLSSLLPHLSQEERRGLLYEEMDLYSNIDNNESTSRILIPSLSDEDLLDISEIIQSIDNGDYRVRVLAKIALNMQGSMQIEIIEQLLDEMCVVENENVVCETLLLIMPYIPEHLQTKLDIATQRITDRNCRVRILWGRKYKQQGTPIMNTVNEEEARGGLLPPKDIYQCIQDEKLLIECCEIWSIANAKERAIAQGALGTRLTGVAQYKILHEALISASTIEQADDRFEVLSKLAVSLAELSADVLFQFFESNNNEVNFLRLLARRTRNDLLSDICALAPLIAAMGNADGISEVINTIQKVRQWWP